MDSISNAEFAAGFAVAFAFSRVLQLEVQERLRSGGSVSHAVF